jgi:hypothetical protein
MSAFGKRMDGEQSRNFLEKEKLFVDLDNSSSFCQQKEGKNLGCPGNLSQGSFDQHHEDKGKILLLPQINESLMIHDDKPGASALVNLSRLPTKV